MKNLTRAGLFAGALVLCTLGSASLHSSTKNVEAKDYLLKVSNVVEAAELVESIGGNVTETAVTIRYMGATLTDEQLQLVSRSKLVVRISEQQASLTREDELAGLWWRKKGQAVAGFWWGKKGQAQT